METKEPIQTRKIRPTRRSISGVYAFRGKFSIPFESSLERDFLKRHEYDKDVSRIVAQPVRLTYRALSGLTYRYTPDFLVSFHPGLLKKPLLVEVKPHQILMAGWQEMRPKFKAASQYARSLGWVFHIYDESRIRDQKLANISFLKKFEKAHFPEDLVEKCLSEISRIGTVSIKDYLSTSPAPEKGQLIWHLLATGRIDCDLGQSLTEESLIKVTGHG